MTRKPSYEELEQRIHELEASLAGTAVSANDSKAEARPNEVDEIDRFQESLSLISKALHSTKDVDFVIGNILETVLKLFNCDRIWLFYPCDPSAPTFKVLAEKTTAQYPGAFTLGQELPVTPEAALTIQKALDSGVPAVFDPESGNEINDVARKFSVLSQMMMAVHPKSGKPWMFGMHQCSHARVWTRYEQHLFQEISVRVAESLSNRILLEELKRSELNYKNLLENLPLRIFHKDINSVYVSCNNNFAMDLGIDPDTIAGTTDYDYFPKDLADKYINDDKNIIATGRSDEFVEKCVTAAGRKFWTNTVKAPLFDDRGNVSGVLGFFRDITKQKEAEEALGKSKSLLAESNQLLSAVLDNTHMLAAYMDPQFNFIWVNSVYAAAGGHEPPFFTHKNYFDLYPHEENMAIFQEVVDSGEPQFVAAKKFEYPSQSDRGATFWDWSLFPVKDEHGKTIGLVLTLAEVTARLQMEEKLAKQHAEFQAIFNSITDAIILVDLERHILMANPAFKSIFGYDIEEVRGETTQILYANPEEYSQQGKGRYHKNAKVTTPVYEMGYRRKDGTFFPGETLGVPVKESNGNIVGFLGVVRDVTDRKKAEQERHFLKKQWEQSQKLEALGTLAGGIAHDFNNILSAIFGYTELAMDDTPAGSKFSQDLDKVLQAAQRAKDLVQQILAFSRQSQAERISLKPESIVKEALKMLRASIPTTIEIQEDMEDDCGSIEADPIQIHQILMNLCTNAFHAMEEKGGILKVELRKTTLVPAILSEDRDEAKQYFLHLSVSDTGTGIAPEVLDKIFDPFFTTKEKGKGTGMGLSITYGIVKDHGGAITVDSQLGEGTTFHVYLPQSEKEGAPRVIEDKDIPPTGKERILFVDDEDLLAEMGKDMLERLGYQVTVKQRSFEALELFQNQPDQFDLVITDQTMPGMTGLDLARRMIQIRPDIPIILCTGFSYLVNEQIAKAQGIKEFALKPMTKNSMAKLIRKVLGNQQ